MIDLIPSIVDGAIVMNLNNTCKSCSSHCDGCKIMTIHFHNWIKLAKIEYVVFDFIDEKEICPGFLEELQLLRKRLHMPMLFAGVMQKPKKVLDQFEPKERYPSFVTPEDAIRALRIQHPGITESVPKLSVLFGQSLLETLRVHQLETGLMPF